MKKITILLSLIIGLFVTSCMPLKTTVVQMDAVSDQVQTEGSKNELYVKANNWMVENFVNAESVIQFTDKESGTVTGKYLLHKIYIAPSTYSAGVDSDIFSIIKIQVKDGAAKISIDPQDFTEIETSNLTYRKLYYSKEKADLQISTLIDSFKAYMATEVEPF